MSRDRRQDVERALLTVEQMVAELPDYFARDELFRQLVVHTPWGDELPKMTLGGLVERLAFLERHQHLLSWEERRRLEEARRSYEDCVHRRHAQVAERLRREFKSYLGSWRWYLDEWRENPRKAADYWSEVHNRLRLSTLIAEAERLGVDLGQENLETLEELDAWLHGHWQPGSFGWQGHDASDFNPEAHWYLYGRAIPGGVAPQ